MKQLTALLLACMLLLCSPAAMAESDAELYRETLDRFAQYIASGAAREPDEGESGVWEALMGMDSVRASEKIGYAIADLSGDGVPELLIGAITHTDGAQFYGSECYALYTCTNHTPQLVFEGWARSRYRLMNDGRFLYEGSSGASRSAFAAYSLSRTAALVCEDFYFTDEKGADGAEIGYYHNRTGEWNPARSKELDHPDIFTIVLDQFDLDVTLTPLTPFALYDTVGVGGSAAVRVQWASSTTSAQPMVAFTASQTVQNFQILSLALSGVDANGQPIFSAQPLYTLGTLTPGNPLTLGMTFSGMIPSNGISYMDVSGVTHRFIVDVSGADGSLTLTAF